MSHKPSDTVLCIVIKDIARTCDYLATLVQVDRPEISKRLSRAAKGFDDMYNEAVAAGEKQLKLEGK